MDCDNDMSNQPGSQNGMNTAPSQSLCRVCGIDNAQVHYGALCCVSCKMFFRRNAQLNLSNRKCVSNGRCNITIKSRKTCRFCRLKKCFFIGMQRELLRASHNRQGTRGKQASNDKKPCLNNNPRTLDLLQNDRSLLKTEQWTCLSNVIHLFDNKFPVPHIRNLLEAQSSYPLKMRLKTAPANMLTLLNAMYQGVYPFVMQIPHFGTLSLSDRSALIERNMRSVGGYSGIVLSRDADVHSSPVFKIGFPSIYGAQLTDEAIRIYKNTDHDGTLIKLFMPIMIFSTGSDLLVISKNENDYKCNGSQRSSNLLSNEQQIFELQNFYTDILFKYMIYRYGYKEAALRFAAIIKTSLDQSSCSINGREVQKHKELMQTIVQQTEHSLASTNEILVD